MIAGTLAPMIPSANAAFILIAIVIIYYLFSEMKDEHKICVAIMLTSS